MTFALDLQKFAEKAAHRADQVVSEIVVGVATRIDDRSPVGARERWAVNIDRAKRNLPPVPKGYVGGRFRGNWQLGIGSLPGGELDIVDPGGTIALPAIVAAIPEDASGRAYFLANNLPYAQELEGGHSKLAPAGIVGRTVIEFQQIVQDAVEALP